MLDMDMSDRAAMSMRETQYAIFELKATQAQEKAVEERTDGKTRDFIKYCNIPGLCVPTRNIFKHKGFIVEKEPDAKKNRKKKQPRQDRLKYSQKGTGHAKRKGNTNDKRGG